MAEVVLDRVTKEFPGGMVAVDAVSLHVADGEFMVLVGPSGCGKSTMLRMVAGLADLDAGHISIGGKIVDHLPPRDRDIAMVFQNYALYPHMTVSGNLSFALRLARQPKPLIQEKVFDAAQVLEISTLLDRKPGALSGGQRQRVAMGRAIVRQPQVFLMDEPLSNLDAKLRVAMRGELSRLHRRYATTTLYVTHDQVEAMTLGHRIAVFDRGRLQQVGTPDEVYQSPRNVFVAGFIGSPAMNLARARVVARAGGLVLVLGEQHWPLPEPLLAQRPALHGYAGREVVVGIRPDHLSTPTEGIGAPTPRLRCRASAVEFLGGELNLLFAPPGPPSANGAHDGVAGRWTARLDRSLPARIGQEVELAVDLAGAYFFDPGTGVAIPTVAAAVRVPVPARSAAA
jgi:multiple sugar transport system ATP-binding protein